MSEGLIGIFQNTVHIWSWLIINVQKSIAAWLHLASSLFLILGKMHELYIFDFIFAVFM